MKCAPWPVPDATVPCSRTMIQRPTVSAAPSTRSRPVEGTMAGDIERGGRRHGILARTSAGPGFGSDRAGRRDQGRQHDRRQVGRGELAPQFEQKTGHKLAITFGVANVLKRQIEAGETFDLAIMTAAVADDLIKQGKIVAATRTDVARGGSGIAVRAGAPRPDIGSVEARQPALLDAPSITYARERGSRVYLARPLQRLRHR